MPADISLLQIVGMDEIFGRKGTRHKMVSAISAEMAMSKEQERAKNSIRSILNRIVLYSFSMESCTESSPPSNGRFSFPCNLIHSL